jgi:hypothetical protein
VLFELFFKKFYDVLVTFDVDLHIFYMILEILDVLTGLDFF